MLCLVCYAPSMLCTGHSCSCSVPTPRSCPRPLPPPLCHYRPHRGGQYQGSLAHAHALPCEQLRPAHGCWPWQKRPSHTTTPLPPCTNHHLSTPPPQHIHTLHSHIHTSPTAPHSFSPSHAQPSPPFHPRPTTASRAPPSPAPCPSSPHPVLLSFLCSACTRLPRGSAMPRCAPCSRCSCFPSTRPPSTCYTQCPPSTSTRAVHQPRTPPRAAFAHSQASPPPAHRVSSPSALSASLPFPLFA